jgi:hypothetical protein
MAIVHFTSTDSFMDHDARAAWVAEIEVHEYIEGTYDELRNGLGEPIALFVDGAWQLPDGRRFSDWAVNVT